MLPHRFVEHNTGPCSEFASSRSPFSLLLCLFCGHLTFLPLQTLRYTVVSNGKTAGSEVDTYGPGGHIDSTFEFNDRGRGPKIEAHYTVAPDGSPLHVDITGNDYLKAAVDEHFSVEAGVGRWKSTSENGQASAPGFYISINGPAAETALLVQALLGAKDTPVKLFPAGEARLERMAEADRRKPRAKIALDRVCDHRTLLRTANRVAR